MSLNALQGEDTIVATDYDADFSAFGWICPTDPEFYAAMAAMDHDCGYIRRRGSQYRYRHGKIGNHNIVIKTQNAAGQRGAEQMAQQMSRSFPKIQDFLLVGIAGGIPEYSIGKFRQSISLGDIVISFKHLNQPWPHITRVDRGTDLPDQFKIAPDYVRPMSDRFLSAITELRQKTYKGIEKQGPWELPSSVVATVMDRARDREPSSASTMLTDPGPKKDYLIAFNHSHPEPTDNISTPCGDDCLREGVDRTQRDHDAQRKEFSPYIHLGPVASCDQFVANPVNRDRLGKQGFLCVEMEAASVAFHFSTITIRGVMDYCDTHRVHASEWRPYAAITAAAAARLLITLVSDDSEVECSTPILDSCLSQQTVTEAYHHLAEMPNPCRAYQHQSNIQDVLETFCLTKNERETRKKVLSGFVGRGKTQACVAFMKWVQESQPDRLVFLENF